MGRRWTDKGARRINPPGCSTQPLADADARLKALTLKAHADLYSLRHPETPWLAPRSGPDGRPMLDVLVVGAGQGGIAVAGLLRREGVDNIALVDRAERDREGVWHDFARMPVVRSPKHFPGPDMGVPSLTYEAWHKARFGEADWDRLSKVILDIPAMLDAAETPGG